MTLFSFDAKLAAVCGELLFFQEIGMSTRFLGENYLPLDLFSIKDSTDISDISYLNPLGFSGHIRKFSLVVALSTNIRA